MYRVGQIFFRAVASDRSGGGLQPKWWTDRSICTIKDAPSRMNNHIQWSTWERCAIYKKARNGEGGPSKPDICALTIIER